MNQKRDESTQNQNDRKNKTVGKTGEISSKFPGITGGISRNISKNVVSQDGFIKIFYNIGDE